MKKEQYIKIKNLTVSENLYSFVNKNLLPGTGISNSHFWNGFNENLHELASKNKELLEQRLLQGGVRLSGELNRIFK